MDTEIHMIFSKFCPSQDTFDISDCAEADCSMLSRVSYRSVTASSNRPVYVQTNTHMHFVNSSKYELDLCYNDLQMSGKAKYEKSPITIYHNNCVFASICQTYICA